MFNKERVKGLVAGALIGAVVAGTAGVFAYTDYIEAVYNDIKIVVDGQQITPDDGTGNMVEPFIYNGTTYLPVRAVANAFGKEADWDGSTNTVILGARSFDWLDQMGYVGYDNTHSTNSTLKTIESNTKATDDTKYNRGMRFYLDGGTYWNNDDETQSCYQEVSYDLNYNYKTFSGTLCTLGVNNNAGALVKIYGDGKELYNSPIMSQGTKSTPFEIDVSGYKYLKIRTEYDNYSYNQMYNKRIYIGVADARLLKK